MSALTYRDISVLRNYGFNKSSLGFSYLATDKAGTVWQAVEDDDTGKLMFRPVLAQGQVGTGSFTAMTRKELSSRFNIKKELAA